MGFRFYDVSPRYVYQTKFGYCFRFVIPPDLRSVISKKEIRYSLKTRDQSQAKALSRRLAGFIQDFCANIRTLVGPAHDPTHLPYSPARYHNLIKAYFRSVIDGDFKSSIQAENLAAQLFDPSLKQVALEYTADLPQETVSSETPEKSEQSSQGEQQNNPVERQPFPSAFRSHCLVYG